MAREDKQGLATTVVVFHATIADFDKIDLRSRRCERSDVASPLPKTGAGQQRRQKSHLSLHYSQGWIAFIDEGGPGQRVLVLLLQFQSGSK